MIPTMFGITVVSFLIMQLAPGDPMLSQVSAQGAAGMSGQTREAYLIQKRDLNLDKPILLNFRGFHDYTQELRNAAYFRAHSDEEIAAALPQLAAVPKDSAEASRLAFLWSLRIPDFSASLKDPQKHLRMAAAIRGYVQVFCEDTGSYGVPDAIRLLESGDLDLTTKIGVIDCLKFMVVEAHQYTYSRDPTAAETPQVTAVWRAWWDHEQARFEPIDPDRLTVLEQQFHELVSAPSRSRQFELLTEQFTFDQEDLPFFAEKLLADSSSLDEKTMAATVLKLYVANPLQMELPLKADDGSDDKSKLKPFADADTAQAVTENWLVHFRPRAEQYHPSLPNRLWNIVADTQYAHMVWRLVTFHFGRSTLKTREPVSGKIWAAAVVSAPLMFMAELVIYFVAIPLGILCAVRHGRFLDRFISLVLYLLYSIPGFVAAMLFLLFLCYGDYVKWFPMERLHSDGAEHFGLVRYSLDYLWHSVLPVVCLSLFSLAGMAMYSRSSMLDVIGQDYIRTARAKGLPGHVVIFKHGMRNSFIPILTLFSNFLPAMLGGSVLIEVLFGVPGMGRLGFDSILLKDIPTVMALIYVDAIVVLLSILVTDILYVFVDPRISFAGQGKS